MRTIRLMVLLYMTMMGVSCSKQIHSATPEELAKSVFQAMVNDDIDMYKSTIFPLDELLEYQKNHMNDISPTELLSINQRMYRFNQKLQDSETKKMLTNIINLSEKEPKNTSEKNLQLEKQKRLTNDYLEKITIQKLSKPEEDFYRVRLQAIGHGLDWNAAKFVKAEYSVREKGGQQHTFVTFHIKSYDSIHVFLLECQQIQSPIFSQPKSWKHASDLTYIERK